MPRSSLDTLSMRERSQRMALVRSRDTKPELCVRHLAHELGFRFRLHRRDLPGSPDLVFPRHRKIIVVHGCFWHRHPGCTRARFPKSPERAHFWHAKFRKNVERDQRARRELLKLGWDVLVIWECQTSVRPRLERILLKFLNRVQRRS